MKTGLVMEGGAMRGMFTCGVIDVFMENGITFDAAVGVSAGAGFGVNYKSHQIGRPIRYNKKYCNDKRYHSISSLIKTGDLFNADFCYNKIPRELDVWDSETFKNDPMDFYVVATDIDTGKPYYYKCFDGGDEDILWLRASSSLPIVSKPVEIDGKHYLDGGISDPIPYKFMEKNNFDRIVVVETQPYDYVKKPQGNIMLLNYMYRKNPKVVAFMKKRHFVYNSEKEYIKEKEKEGKALVLRPEQALGIKRAETNPDELERVYQEGRKVALDNIEKIREYLEQ